MLKKKFSSTYNTVEAFGSMMPFVACECDPICNCSCQSDLKKSSTKKASTRETDYAASAKVKKWSK